MKDRRLMIATGIIVGLNCLITTDCTGGTSTKQANKSESSRGFRWGYIHIGKKRRPRRALKEVIGRRRSWLEIDGEGTEGPESV